MIGGEAPWSAKGGKSENGSGGGAEPALRPLSRRVAHWALALVSVLVFASQLPLTPGALLERTIGFAEQLTMPFDIVHGRPSEYCPPYLKAKVAFLKDLQGKYEDPEKERLFLPDFGAIADVVRQYSEFKARAFGKSWDGWVVKYGAMYQSYFSKQAPYAWFQKICGWNEIHFALIVHILLWIGGGCLFAVASRLGGSFFIGGLSVAAAVICIKHPSHYGVLYQFPLLFVSMFLVQAASGRERLFLKRPVLSFCSELFLLLCVCGVSVVTVMLFSPVHAVVAKLVIALLFIVGAVERSRVVLIRATVCLVLVLLVSFPHKNFARSLLRPVVTEDHVDYQAYLAATAICGLSERPTYHSPPVADFTYYWLDTVDISMLYTAPGVVHHQGYHVVPNQYVADILLTRPLSFVDAIWKRLFVQVARHKNFMTSQMIVVNAQRGKALPLFYGFNGDAWWERWFYVSVFAVFLALLFGFSSRLGFSLVLPSAALALWANMGVTTILQMYHGHSRYLIDGYFVLLSLSPAFVSSFAIGSFVFARRAYSGLMSRKIQVCLVCAILVSLIASPYFYREAKKELIAEELFYQVYNGRYFNSIGFDVSWVASKLEHMRDLGGESPGVMDMFSAWMFFIYDRYWYGSELELLPSIRESTPRQREELRRLAGKERQRCYANALVAAPDNPHWPAYARLLMDGESWVAVYQDALRRFPDHYYALNMAWSLAYGNSNPSNWHRYAPVYDELLRRFYYRTEKYRWGFRRLPSPDAGFGRAVEVVEQGVKIVLGPSETCALEPFDVFGAPKPKVLSYLNVLRGMVDSALRVVGDTPVIGPTQRSHYGALRRYGVQHVDNTGGAPQAQLVFTAGPQGAEFVVRDMYPLIETVRYAEDNPLRMSMAGE